MAGPLDEGPAAGRGRLRASHADRDQVLDVLKAAFVQGRLSRDELDERLARALASRTYAELAEVTADLPIGLIAAELPARATRTQPPANRATRSGLGVISVGTALAASAWAAAWLTGSTQLFMLAITITIAAFGSVLVAGSVMLEARHQQRSSGQLPPRRGGSGRASGLRPSAGPAGPFRQLDHGPHIAQAAGRPGLRPALSLIR